MKFWSRVVMAAAGVAFGLSAAVAYAAPTPAPPSAPRNLTAAAGDTQVTLTWNAPTTGAPITSYQVITAPADFPRTNVTTTSVTAVGLHNGTPYSFAVRAANASGYGPAARVTATPHVIPPSAPTNLAATAGPSAGQTTLSWTPPTSNGSAPSIDHYTITVSPGGVSAQVSGQTTTYVASNLADNVTYTFTVTATNSKNATGRAATVYAPLPVGATIGLQPTAGGASTVITVTGQQFLQNEAITLYWDTPSHVAASVVTDDNGAFVKSVKPFAGDKPSVHKICASVQPKPCANFSLQAAPTPTPPSTPSPGETPTPTPSPSSNPVASGARAGGSSGLDFLTKPPFVFVPIIGILLLLGVLAYWLFSRRRTPYSPAAATVVHRATRPDYMTPFPPQGTPPATGAPPPAQPGQSAWESPVQTAWQQPPAHPLPEVTPAPFVPAQPPAPPATPPAPPPAQPAAMPPIPAPQWPEQQPPPAPPAAPPGPEPPTPTVWPALPDEPPDLPQPSD